MYLCSHTLKTIDLKRINDAECEYMNSPPKLSASKAQPFTYKQCSLFQTLFLNEAIILFHSPLHINKSFVLRQLYFFTDIYARPCLPVWCIREKLFYHPGDLKTR